MLTSFLSNHSYSVSKSSSGSIILPCTVSCYGKLQLKGQQTPLMERSYSITHIQPLNTISLLHKHADLYNGRTSQSHADGMFDISEAKSESNASGQSEVYLK